MQKSKVGIRGVGSYLPEKILTNADLEKMVDTSDEWIVARTGIKSRRIAREEEPSSELAVKASRSALASAGIAADELDLIIVATITGDMPLPATACIVQEKLGAFRAACFDLNAACSGWIYGMDIAWQFVRNGTFRNALIIGAEKLSSITDWEDRNTCVLFGDGAGAALLSETGDGSEILSSYLGADGRWGRLLYVPGGGSLHPASRGTVEGRMHYIRMEGKEVFKQAVSSMAASATIALERAGLRPDQISLFIPHQANLRIMKAVAKRLKVPLEKFCIAVDHCGNISAASIPVALEEAVSSGRLGEGDTVCFVAFGGGFTWGAMVAKM